MHFRGSRSGLGRLKPFVLGFYKKSGFHFSEPDLLIRKEIKYPDPCHPLRKTLLCRLVRVSARFMAPKIHFFIFCSATLTIRAKSGLRPCSYYFPDPPWSESGPKMTTLSAKITFLEFSAGSTTFHRIHRIQRKWCQELRFRPCLTTRRSLRMT